MMFDFKNHRMVAQMVEVDSCFKDFDNLGPLTVDGRKITTKAEFEQAVPDEKNIESVTVLGSQNATDLYGEKGKDGAVIITTNQSATADADSIFTLCEEMPKYEGGDAALMQFIASNIKYPELAIEQGVQGRVMVKFVVEKDGTVSQPQVVKNTYTAKVVYGSPVAVTAQGQDIMEEIKAERQKIAADILNAEAMRVALRTYGHWTPGRQHGQPVRSWYVLPVTFRLN